MLAKVDNRWREYNKKKVRTDEIKDGLAKNKKKKSNEGNIENIIKKMVILGIVGFEFWFI